MCFLDRFWQRKREATVGVSGTHRRKQRRSGLGLRTIYQRNGQGNQSGALMKGMCQGTSEHPWKLPQWGCVTLFNPLAVPPCNGVIVWIEVEHLLQKY